MYRPAPALLGVILLFPAAGLLVPAAAARPAPRPARAAPARPATGDPGVDPVAPPADAAPGDRPTRAAPGGRPPGAEPGRAEPSPRPDLRAAARAGMTQDELSRVDRLRKRGRVLRYTGMSLTGLGIAVGIAGAVLLGLSKDRAGRWLGGIINLSAGVGLIAGGTVTWACGVVADRRADAIRTKALLRLYTLHDPPAGVPTRLTLLPRSVTAASLTLKF